MTAAQTLRRTSVLIIAAVIMCALAAPAGVGAPAPAALSRHTLANGLTLVIKESGAADLVAVTLLVRAGSRVEEPADAGASFFVNGMLLRGTQRRSAAEIAVALESVGGILRANTAPDYIDLSAVTTTRYTETALDLLADLATGARFDPADVETQRRISLSRIRQQADQPLSRAIDLMAERLYPLHPYGKPLLGTAESVTALTRAQLLAFYQTYFTAPNMMLAVAGNVKSSDALDKVRRAFAGVRSAAAPRRLRLLPVVESALAPRPGATQEVREARRTAAAWIALGYLGVDVGHRDWAALRVLSAILGEGLSSRLFVEIREKQGLAYQVGSAYPTRAGPSPVILFAGTDPGNVDRVAAGLQREVARLAEGTLPADELERAKQRVIGRHALDHEDMQRQAFLLAWYELLGVGFSFDARLSDLIAAVRAEDVQRAVRLYLQHPVLAIVLPPPR